MLAPDHVFGFSLLRGRSLNIDLYLSTTTIHNSFTVILVGSYLLAVGLLAQFTRVSASGGSLPLDAFVVFIALTVLAVLVLSNRLRLFGLREALATRGSS